MALSEDPAKAAEVLIGIVGYSPVIDSYPLGPKLMNGLKARIENRHDIAVENMTWSPIHVVQRFQDEGAIRPRRVVLIGAAAVSVAPGQVRGFRWGGGTVPGAAMQERIYEAVTGVVDLENTLIIGSHFGVWPDEVFCVEVDLPADTFGNMVIADSLGDQARVGSDSGFSPSAVIAAVVQMALAFALDAPGQTAQTKSASECAGIRPFIRNWVTIDA
ncbi:MAG: hypothetical protein H0W65_08305 [Sphingomonas sp.]|uniref:hypothetical protein n=1 Tax=Sphingomonas sp. TaxID=28214 RepID=UPI001853280C|nr:hypothetical protein [Sphingomonas sp.]MBA3667710.1 hypothetical protein [Sphingomonas sp.]